MNVFLDTSILLKDPHFIKNYNREFLTLVKKGKILLYMSNVVLLELEWNFRKLVDESNKTLTQIIGKGLDYKLVKSPLVEINKEESVENLLKFYAYLIEEGFLKILEYENNLLPEIVERSVKRIKPFTESKTELKDTIIWLTYARHIEKNDINDCVFLTDNVSDFCDLAKNKHGIVEIHDDLKKDCNRFKVYRSTSELLRSESEKLTSSNERFIRWGLNQQIDSDAVFSILTDNFKIKVYNSVKLFCESKNVKQIFNFIENIPGSISVTKIKFDFCEDIIIDTFESNCIISGNLYLTVSVDGYLESPNNENNGTEFKKFDSTYVNVRLFFSFSYGIEQIPSDFGIDRIEILKL